MIDRDTGSVGNLSPVERTATASIREVRVVVWDSSSPA